jgi:hypothetical protein
MNMSHYTITESPEAVSVREFRFRISHLEDLVNRDYHACRNDTEKANWARIVRRIGGELVSTSCKRATETDWDRRERIIEASTTRLIRVAA